MNSAKDAQRRRGQAISLVRNYTTARDRIVAEYKEALRSGDATEWLRGNQALTLRWKASLQNFNDEAIALLRQDPDDLASYQSAVRSRREGPQAVRDVLTNVPKREIRKLIVELMDVWAQQSVQDQLELQDLGRAREVAAEGHTPKIRLLLDAVVDQTVAFEVLRTRAIRGTGAATELALLASPEARGIVQQVSLGGLQPTDVEVTPTSTAIEGNDRDTGPEL